MSGQLNPDDTIAVVIDIAADAAHAILGVYEGDFQVEEKGDESPLTEADLASNRIIRAGLESLEPCVPILSEEAAHIPFQERSRWSRYWLVDPLDGTREFVKRNGEFTVNIALIEDNRPILGVVLVPVTGSCYAARKGGGAFKIEGSGAKHRIGVRTLCPEHLTVVGSRSHGNAMTQAFIERLGDVEMISIGSSLKICLVAEGRADIYPRFGPTSEWDTAAAQCVVEEAGGFLTDSSMQALRYNTKESLLNPHFLVFGDRSGNWQQYIPQP